MAVGLQDGHSCPSFLRLILTYLNPAKDVPCGVNLCFDVERHPTRGFAEITQFSPERVACVLLDLENLVVFLVCHRQSNNGLFLLDIFLNSERKLALDRAREGIGGKDLGPANFPFFSLLNEPADNLVIINGLRPLTRIFPNEVGHAQART